MDDDHRLGRDDLEAAEINEHLDADDSLLGAAGPLCSYCQGEHLAADCPTRTASAAPAPDAEGTR